MPFGAACLSISLYFISRVGAVWQFYLIVIIGRAVSQPILTGVVPRAIAVNFFRRRRNVALSLTGISRPISAALNIQLISLVVLAYGWRIAFRFLGFASLALPVVFFLFIRRRPEDIGPLPDGAQPSASGPAEASRAAKASVPSTGNGVVYTDG
jgi:sugar phosphate permease